MVTKGKYEMRTGLKANIYGEIHTDPHPYIVVLDVPSGSDLTLKQVKENHLAWLMKVVQPDPEGVDIWEYEHYMAVFSPEQVIKVSERYEVALIDPYLPFPPLSDLL